LSEDFLLSEVFICGDAEHCAERIEGLRERTGAGEVLATFNYFTLPHERCRESMERFAAEVLPRLRGDGAVPDPRARRRAGVAAGG
jgi:alkanesulfonate monooxygenase SsuD/methylene tetrahydromethanopterin reductase-like flavin-dependent oxidoreductase (luciferase family)